MADSRVSPAKQWFLTFLIAATYTWPGVPLNTSQDNLHKKNYLAKNVNSAFILWHLMWFAMLWIIRKGGNWKAKGKQLPRTVSQCNANTYPYAQNALETKWDPQYLLKLGWDVTTLGLSVVDKWLLPSYYSCVHSLLPLRNCCLWISRRFQVSWCHPRSWGRAYWPKQGNIGYFLGMLGQQLSS